MLEAEYLYLEDHPIASPSSIVDGRPTCYRARRKTSDRWEFMAKLVWRESNQRAHPKRRYYGWSQTARPEVLSGCLHIGTWGAWLITAEACDLGRSREFLKEIKGDIGES
jgi:hypothetical protein